LPLPFNLPNQPKKPVKEKPMAHAASRATPSRALIAPSPDDQATLILRHFLALKPVLNTEAGHWEAPSKTHANVIHTITLHKDANGMVERRCDCPSKFPCTHLRLVERMTHGQPAHLETIHYTQDADFDRRWAGLMRSHAMPGGLA
jgi:hypothetical protein